MKYDPLRATLDQTMKTARSLLLSLIVMTMLGIPGFSQGTVGSMLGDVTDATGARLPGATVRLVNQGTSATRETLTTEVGSYRFNGLQPVVYTVTVEFPGFTTVARPDVKVNAGSDIKIDFVLDVSATVETITVTEQAPLVETTENAIKTLIDSTKIRELPLKSRDFMDLALLSPGVVTDQASDRRGTLTDSISFGGMPERFKSMWLEGVDINDEVTGGGSAISSATRTQLAQEAVQEFQVMANSYSAEFGRSATGVINIVTKSGTNEFHGNAFYFRRDDAFDKKPYFSDETPPFKAEQYGATLGGPIKEDKAHFFLSYERRSSDQVAFVVIPPQLVSFVNGLGYSTKTDVPNPWRFHNLFSKTTVTISPEHTLSVVAVYDNRIITNTTAGGNLSFDSGYIDDRNSHFITASLSSLFGSSIVNEFRINRSDQELFRDSQKERPELRFPSITFGRDNTQGRRQQNWIASDTLTWNVGNHSIKFGGEANRVLGTYVSSANREGAFDFKSDLPVDPNDPSTLPFRFTQGLELKKGRIDVRGFDTAAYTRNSNLLAVYINDSWRMTPNFTMNFGLRYDLQQWRGDIDGTPFPDDIPEFELWKRHLNGDLRGHPFAPVPDDTNNFSPRVGFAWDLKGDGRTVMRGGYGVFYDSLWTSTVRGIVQNYAGYRQTNLGNDVRSSGVPNDFFPNYPGGRKFGETPDRSIMKERAASRVRLPSRTASNPFMHQFSGGVDHQIADGTAIGFNFIHMYGQDLGFTRNVNACIASCAKKPKIYPLDSSGIRMELLDQSNITKSNQFQMRLEKRFLTGRALSMSYTLGEIKEYASGPADHYNLRAHFGPTRNDIRHRFTGNYTHELPGGIRLGVIGTFTSKAPYNITTGNDDNGDGQRRDHPEGGGYNSGRGDNLKNVDIRTSKIFMFGESQSLEVMWEMFNVFNTVNLVNYNGNMKSSRFGKPSIARDPFQGQFGIRYTF